MPADPRPLDRLLTLGAPDDGPAEWPDYGALGIGPEHVPPLIGMATDPRPWTADEPAFWAPLHAWRALGQLQAIEAAAPLAALFHLEEARDWASEELPHVFAMLGPATMPVLVRYLDERARGVLPRATALEALRMLAQRHPVARDEIAGIMQRQLGHFVTQDRELNGLLAAALLDLDAVEAAPTMERAFAADCVDISIVGDWEDVQVAFGLLAERTTPRPRYARVEGWVAGPPAHAPRSRRGERKRLEKHKRKLGKQAKRRNRRR